MQYVTLSYLGAKLDKKVKEADDLCSSVLEQNEKLMNELLLLKSTAGEPSCGPAEHYNGDVESQSFRVCADLSESHERKMDELKHILTCPVCLDEEAYISGDPTVLIGCGHTICSKCEAKWRTASGKKASCPICQRAIITPVDHAPINQTTNYTVKSMVQTIFPTSPDKKGEEHAPLTQFNDITTRTPAPLTPRFDHSDITTRTPAPVVYAFRRANEQVTLDTTASDTTTRTSQSEYNDRLRFRITNRAILRD